MRLIDADRINFQEIFGGMSEYAKDVRRAAQELIDRQPTAYDLDKAIEQAEINLKAACERYDECNADTLPVLYAECRTRYKERKICLEIIKSGCCQEKGATDDEQTQADLI